MIKQSFYMCLAAIAVAGILQAPWVRLSSLFKRFFGAMIFSFTLIPLLMNSSVQAVNGFGLSFSYHSTVLTLTIILSTIIATINWFSAGSEGNMAIYPQIRESVWGISLTTLSAFAWTLYLTMYEVVFRGIFLYSSVSLIGLWPATFLNVALYSLAHLLKNKREAILSIPFGFITIYLTWISGSCWYAVVLHVILALSHEWSSIRANPNMRFDFSLNLKKTS